MMIRLLLIALRNLKRNKLRSSLTVLGASIAILTFILLRTVLSAWEVAAKYSAQDRIATRHKMSIAMTLPKRYIDDVRGLSGVKQATYMNWFGARHPARPDDFFATMAVDPPSFLQVYDEVTLSPADRQRWLEDRKGALVGDLLAKKLGLKVGDKVTLSGTIYPGDWEFNVAGIYTSARKSIDRSTWWLHWDYMNDAQSEARMDQVGWIASRVDDPGKGPSVSAGIDLMFDQKDVPTTTMSERQINLSFLGMFSAVLTALEVISLIILGVMLLILGNTMAMGVRERTREYGVLRALGFEPGHVRGFVIGEALGLGLLTALVGIGLAYLFIELGMRRFVEEQMGAWFPYFRIEAGTYVAAILLGIGLALAAAAIPAIRAGRLQVTEALRRVA
jgi:putative ABC transport system permease protein